MMPRLNCQQTTRDYEGQPLSLSTLSTDPIEQFIQWYHEATVSESLDPNAMTLSTVDNHNLPDSRIVLLKEIDEKGFVFFTHYESEKALQITAHSSVALNFYWPTLSRQVRVQGHAERISSERSAAYFATRSRQSQLTVYASPQGQIINEQTLADNMAQMEKHFENQPIPCPLYWGGYCVVPFSLEFFQGRQGRLHDRIRYTRINEGKWEISRIAP